MCFISLFIGFLVKTFCPESNGTKVDKTDRRLGMKIMEYTIKAIETRFRNFVFRSRLEAKWAAMFEFLGWDWDYEPVDFNGWIPDFVIYGYKPVYVEVKPVFEFPGDVSKELERSGCSDEMLIVGQKCLLKDCDATSFDQFGLCFGWLAEFVEGDGLKNEISWQTATFGRWKKGEERIGFCSSMGWFRDRISGGYDGGRFGNNGEVTGEEIKKLWAHAHNATRWMKG